jgi:hypothetical protein
MHTLLLIFIWLLTVMIQCWSMRPIVVWPLGKLYSGFDLSGRRYDLRSRAAKYVEGPDGLPYSAHEIKTETSYSYLEFRPTSKTLFETIFETIQYSHTVLVYFLHDALHHGPSTLFDFRCINFSRRFDNNIMHSFIYNNNVLVLRESDHCKAHAPLRDLQPGKWYFISLAYVGKTGLLRTSVNGVFKEHINPGCAYSVRRVTNCLYIGNNPYRNKRSVNGATHRLACFEIHDGFLTAGEVLKRQELCIGRGR